MEQRDFSLQNTSFALSDAQDAVHLNEQKERLEQAIISEDAPLALDVAKSLLESIFKTVLSDRVAEPNLEQNFKPLYRNVRDELPFSENGSANDLLGNLGSAIVHNVSELRNRFGAASHGDDGYFETPIQMNDAEMVAHVVDGLAGFVYRKHKHFNDPESAQRIYYSDYPEFNSYLDGQYPSYKIELGERGWIDLPPSEIVFITDRPLYREMLVQFRATEESDEVEEKAEDVDQDLRVEEASVQSEPEPEPMQEIDPIQDIASALVFNEETRNSITSEQRVDVADFVGDYARNRAGIDWQNRDSLIAKFRILIKRRLIRIAYSEAFIDLAVDSLLEKAMQYYPSEYSE